MEDLQIIALYENRKEEAVRETDRKYGRLLYAQAGNILPDRRDREEAVSDTYVRVWNAIPPEKPLCFKAWLLKLARRLCIDRFRALNSEKRRSTEYALSLEELGDCISGSEDLMDALREKELRHAIDRFLRQLPQRERTVFLCRYFFADPIKTIASQYDLKEANVKTLLYRTRQSLKQYLQQEGLIL